MSEKLCSKLGYHFKQPKLLKRALTHRSFNDENNERLEFLGDAVVNFVIGEALYRQFPNAHEGSLSRWRATLINRDTLGDLARDFELGRYLYLGPGELKSGGSQRQSILSCSMEAVIGAIFIDAGFDTTRDCILKWYEPLLQSLSHAASHKDPKTALQEYLQRRHRALPVYTVDAIEGEAHQQIFVIRCSVEDVPQHIVGKGTSRRRAEQEAALAMLGVLKNERR